jgi:putative ABC transport system ATP-binding protein
MTSSELLLAQDVTASRPGEDGSFVSILQKTTLGVAPGEVLSVAGPSGSGKSTLLRLFNRLLEPDSGQVMLSGKNIKTLPPPVLRAQIPLVAQKPYLFPGTVKDNLLASARLRRVEPPELQSPDIKNLIEMCRVEQSWLDRDARKLSVGQQQRVCLVRALVGPCRALLLDEPTSALDRQTGALMAQTFKLLAKEKGLAMILVTHDLQIAEICADRIALMIGGSVIETGPVAQVLNDPKVKASRQFLSSTVTDNGGIAT